MKTTRQPTSCMMQWSSSCYDRVSYVERCMKLQEQRAAILLNSFFDINPGLMQCANFTSKDGMTFGTAWVPSTLTLVHGIPSTYVHVLLLLNAMMRIFWHWWNPIPVLPTTTFILTEDQNLQQPVLLMTIGNIVSRYLSSKRNSLRKSFPVQIQTSYFSRHPTFVQLLDGPIRAISPQA